MAAAAVAPRSQSLATGGFAARGKQALLVVPFLHTTRLDDWYRVQCGWARAAGLAAPLSQVAKSFLRRLLDLGLSAADWYLFSFRLARRFATLTLLGS